jgi:hypothetical protein
MAAICSPETSIASQQTTRRHIPEDDTLHNHRCENLKSYILELSPVHTFPSCFPRSISIFFQICPVLTNGLEIFRGNFLLYFHSSNDLIAFEDYKLENTSLCNFHQSVASLVNTLFSNIPQSPFLSDTQGPCLNLTNNKSALRWLRSWGLCLITSLLLSELLTGTGLSM